MTFLDTNVLVYAVDKLDAAKQARSLAVVTEAISTPGFMVSAQVLNEFSNVALLKLKLTTGEVRQFVNVFNRMRVVPVDPKWTDRALTIKSQYGTQFFDSLLIAAAESSGCDTIFPQRRSRDLCGGRGLGSAHMLVHPSDRLTAMSPAKLRLFRTPHSACFAARFEGYSLNRSGACGDGEKERRACERGSVVEVRFR